MRYNVKSIFSVLIIISMLLTMGVSVHAVDPNADGGGAAGNQSGTWLSSDNQGLMITFSTGME